MWNSLGTKLALAALLTFGLMGCGGNDNGASPASLQSSLLPISEIPGFKSERKLDWDNPIDFATQGLVLPESTPPSQAVEALENAGFEAGVGERFVAAKGSPFEGPHGGQEVAELGSDDDAREALDYARKEALKQPCFAVCSVEGRKFAVPGIPGAKGVQLTPQPDPPPDAPPPFVAYSVGFTIGPRLFLINADGGPGQVTKTQVVNAAEALYERNSNSDAANDAVTTGKHDAAAGIERFLLARGEEPGYQPNGPVEKLSSAEEYAARGPRPQAVARRLRDEGFVSFVRRPLEGKEGVGVTSLLLFRSAAGAKREAAAERRSLDVEFRGWTLKRFDVTGVPGAFGWTARKAGHRVGNITWVEGRCDMTLGNEVGNEGTSSAVASLTAGVRAVHRRVAGRCP